MDSPDANNCESNIIYRLKTKYALLKDMITSTIEQETQEATRQDSVRQYLDLFIDDHIGLLNEKAYCIDVNSVIVFLNIKSNKEDIRSKFINGKYSQYKLGQDYIVQAYSQLGIDKRMQGEQGIKNKKNIFLLPFTAKQFILQSESSVGHMIRQYFIIVEKLQRQIMIKEVKYKKRFHEKIKKEMFEAGLFQVLSDEDDKLIINGNFFERLLDIIVFEKEDQYLIDKEILFILSEDAKNRQTMSFFYQTISQSVGGIASQIIKRQGKITFQQLKLYLLRYDKLNPKVQLFKKYFIIMEHLFLKRLQRQFDLLQDQWNALLKQCDATKLAQECFFYVIQLDDDVFKYGRASRMYKRNLVYNTGRLGQTKIMLFVKMKGCALLEQKIREMMKPYRMRGEQEMVCLDKQTLVDLISMIVKDWVMVDEDNVVV